MNSSKYPKAGLIRADSMSVVITWFFMGLTGVLWLFQAFGVYAVRPAIDVDLTYRNYFQGAPPVAC